MPLIQNIRRKAETPRHYLKCRGVWSVAINTKVKMPASTIAYVEATIAYIMVETDYEQRSLASSYDISGDAENVIPARRDNVTGKPWRR